MTNTNVKYTLLRIKKYKIFINTVMRFKLNRTKEWDTQIKLN